MVTLRSMRPLSWRAPSPFDYEQPPDARTRSNGAGVVREKDPVSWLLFLAAFSDEGGSAHALAEAGVLTVADAAISIA